MQQKKNQFQKTHIFGFFDLNGNKVTYTRARFIVYILNENLYLLT